MYEKALKNNMLLGDNLQKIFNKLSDAVRSLSQLPKETLTEADRRAALEEIFLECLGELPESLQKQHIAPFLDEYGALRKDVFSLAGANRNSIGEHFTALIGSLDTPAKAMQLEENLNHSIKHIKIKGHTLIDLEKTMRIASERIKMPLPELVHPVMQAIPAMKKSLPHVTAEAGPTATLTDAETTAASVNQRVRNLGRHASQPKANSFFMAEGGQMHWGRVGGVALGAVLASAALLYLLNKKKSSHEQQAR
jgi:hypothetical protein